MDQIKLEWQLKNKHSSYSGVTYKRCLLFKSELPKLNGRGAEDHLTDLLLI